MRIHLWGPLHLPRMLMKFGSILSSCDTTAIVSPWVKFTRWCDKKLWQGSGMTFHASQMTFEPRWHNCNCVTTCVDDDLGLGNIVGRSCVSLSWILSTFWSNLTMWYYQHFEQTSLAALWLLVTIWPTMTQPPLCHHDGFSTHVGFFDCWAAYPKVLDEIESHLATVWHNCGCVTPRIFACLTS